MNSKKRSDALLPRGWSPENETDLREVMKRALSRWENIPLDAILYSNKMPAVAIRRRVCYVMVHHYGVNGAALARRLGFVARTVRLYVEETKINGQRDDREYVDSLHDDIRYLWHG